jgi:hypothetical protein
VNVLKIWSHTAVCAAVLLMGVGLAVQDAPAAKATVCGSVGGARIDVSGCADPLYQLNDVLAPPPPPPPGAPPPPPPPPAYVPAPAPNISVCASVGRRISISGCV